MVSLGVAEIKGIPSKCASTKGKIHLLEIDEKTLIKAAQGLKD
jgi:hypothetical protein